MGVTHRKPKGPQNIWEYAQYVLLAMFKVLKVMIKTFLLIIVAAGLVLLVFGTFKLYPIYKDYKVQMAALVYNSTPEDFRMPEASFIYDTNGDVIAKLTGDEDSTYLPYDEIPKDAVNAFVAIEDRTFWTNSGIDLKGIIRVGLNYFVSDGSQVHGASTITQQLARNRFLTREVSIERKAKEILLSLDLTKKYTKEQIMEFYINDISFANTYYGLQAAARGYFGKDAKDLTLSQTAYLCAIPNSPTFYNPYKNPENALKRRDKILKDMLAMGAITQEQYTQALNEKITVQKGNYTLRNYETTYAIDCAIRFLMHDEGFVFKYGFQNQGDYDSYEKQYDDAYNRAKDALYTGGYNIYTSLDPAKQQVLQESIDNVLSFDKSKADNGIYALQGAATVVDNKTNRVVAIVGGRSQDTNTYTLNRAFQSFRQPGSTIKPLIVYSPALENGYISSSTVRNISVDDAKKKGADIKSLPGDTMPLRRALELSKNGVAWWLYDQITPGVGMGYLTQMRFDNIVPNDYFQAQALGGFTYGVTTEEMAGAYSSFVNGGIYHEPTCLVKLVNNKGEDVFKDYPEVSVYQQNTAYDMLDIMKGVITRGTASAMNWKGKIEAAGKTGTTNSSKDGWFCGMTPYYTLSVWVGYDQPKMLSSLYGGTYPANIWKKAMVQFVDGKEPAAFTRPGPETGGLGGESGLFLAGHDEGNKLAPGYTVRDYRRDHELADQAQAMMASGYTSGSKSQAQALVNQIRLEPFRTRMNAVLSAGGIKNIMLPSNLPEESEEESESAESESETIPETLPTETPLSPAYDKPPVPQGPAAVGPGADIDEPQQDGPG